MARGVGRWTRWQLLELLRQRAAVVVPWAHFEEHGPRNNTYQLIHQLRRAGAEIYNLRNVGYLLPTTARNAAILERLQRQQRCVEWRRWIAGLQRQLRRHRRPRRSP